MRRNTVSFTPEYMTNNAPTWSWRWVAVGGRGRLKGAVFGALLVNLVYNFLTSLRARFLALCSRRVFIRRGRSVFQRE